MNRFFMTFLFACLYVYASAPEHANYHTLEHQIGHPPQLEALVQDMYQHTGWQNYSSSTIGNGQVLDIQRVVEPYVPEYSTEMAPDGLWTNTERSISEDIPPILPSNDPLFPDWQLHSHRIMNTANGPTSLSVYYRVH